MDAGTGPCSMTGFAEVQAKQDGWSMWLSVRSVNHRFLDLHIHLPDGWERLEPLIRRVVRGRVRRGRVDVRLSVTPSAPSAIGMNHEVAAAYLKIIEALGKEFHIEAQPDLAQILRLPGVISSGSLPPGPEHPSDDWAAQCVNEVLERLDEMRMAEGRAMRDDLRLHLRHIVELAGRTEHLASAATPLFARRLRERLKELLGNEVVDPARLATEAALAAQRSDVNEEMARLRSHAAQFETILVEGRESGKKLDFLLQEMHREANTLLSKISGGEAESLEMTKLGLEMKSEIEKLREQVQNLE